MFTFSPISHIQYIESRHMHTNFLFKNWRIVFVIILRNVHAFQEIIKYKRGICPHMFSSIVGSYIKYR